MLVGWLLVNLNPIDKNKNKKVSCKKKGQTTVYAKDIGSCSSHLEILLTIYIYAFRMPDECLL